VRIDVLEGIEAKKIEKSKKEELIDIRAYRDLTGAE
jgi:hypothetical protein